MLFLTNFIAKNIENQLFKNKAVRKLANKRILKFENFIIHNLPQR